MLISFEELITKHKIIPTGVLHIGANDGAEYEAYKKAGVKSIIFIEADPKIAAALKEKLKEDRTVRVYNVCASDKDNEETDFHITNNDGQSSSMRELKLHKKEHPDVKVKETIKLRTLTIDSLISALAIDMSEINFLNIDIQGAELEALKGMRETIKNIEYAYIEVSDSELYEGQALKPEIDAWLSEVGFVETECKMTGHHWGDCFYTRTVVPGVEKTPKSNYMAMLAAENLNQKNQTQEAIVAVAAPVVVLDNKGHLAEHEHRINTSVNELQTELQRTCSETFAKNICNKLRKEVTTNFKELLQKIK